MWEAVKKVLNMLMNFPAFSSLIKNALSTGKVDPRQALSALSTISPSTKNIADTAIDTVQRGGGVPQAASALMNMGKISVMGQEVDTRTLPQELKRAGGICSVLGNMLESMPKQDPADIVKFGEAASRVENWSEIVNQ